jgi:YD repeat-containing protein
MSPFHHHFSRAGLMIALNVLVPFAGAQTYSYDDAGRLVTAAYPDGSGVRYTYDTSGNLIGVSALTIPVAPAAPTIAATDPSTAEISWDAVSGATNGYTVQRRSVATDTWTTLAQVPAGRTSFSDTGIPAGTGVLYRLQATGGGSSAFSAAALAPAIVGAAVARLVNISTRARVGADPEVLIAGFHIAGSEPRPVVIRAVGPALLAVDPNFPNPLADPVLEIFDGSSRSVMRNDNWSDGGAAGALTSAFANVGAFPFPAGSRDAALRLTLSPGDYTAVISGAGGTSGTALAEVYDETSTGGSRATNISSRALVRLGAEVLIAGFVIKGDRPARVLIRAAGPALAAFGILGSLTDPQLVVHSGASEAARNDNWSAEPDAAPIRNAATAIGAFAFADGSRDAALLLTLAPGNYSATVSGVGNTTGIALIEVYQLD